MEKADIGDSDFNDLVDSLLQYINVVSEIDLHKIEEAEKIIGHIDLNDVTFIALALSIENDGIWSDDAHFQKQENIKVYKTEDIVRILEENDGENKSIDSVEKSYIN
jgi:predicted nucleic acid-binding protein